MKRKDDMSLSFPSIQCFTFSCIVVWLLGENFSEPAVSRNLRLFPLCCDKAKILSVCFPSRSRDTCVSAAKNPLAWKFAVEKELLSSGGLEQGPVWARPSTSKLLC